MKRFIPFLLVVALCLALPVSYCEENVQTVSLQDFLSSEGSCGDCMLSVTIEEILNPVLAVVGDGTASVNLFGISVIDNFFGFMEGQFEVGDRILLSNPVYNVFEGSVELAESQFAGFAPDMFEGTPVTLQQWMDAKGTDDAILTVRVAEIVNPALARVEDRTGSVNLFGLNVGGEGMANVDAGICVGDILILGAPGYNEFEGSVEMAEPVLLRRIALTSPEADQ